MEEQRYRKIAASAESLHERIRNEHIGGDGAGEGLTDAEQKFFDETDIERIERLWMDQEYEADSIAEYLEFERWPDDEPLPEWISEFTNIVDSLATVDGSDPISTDTGAESPFEDIFRPIIEYSRESVVNNANTERVTESAFRDFEQMLLDQLVDVSAQALHVDFISYIAENDPAVIREDRRSPDSQKWYDEYVTAFFDGRAGAFFEEYAVAAKLLTTSVRQWRAVVTTFLSRLQDDLGEIRSLCGDGEIEQVSEVSSMGDSHGGGERVLLVTFDTGEEIVYKPRSIDPEAQLYEFESWLNREFDEIPELETPNLVLKSEYGWVEKIEREDHSDLEAIKQYYQGAGALLCILYALNVTDCHYENIIAGGSSPVLIDPETILEMGSSPVNSPYRKMNEKLRRYVLNSSIIGSGALPNDTIPNNSSGVAGIGGRQAQIRRLSWIHVNTDAMDIEYDKPTGDPGNNFPTLAGEPAPPDHFVDEIVAGFCKVYDTIVSSKDRVKDQLADEFEGMQTRVLLRNSRAYSLLLKSLTTPEHLRSGASSGYKIQEVLSMNSDSPVLRRETKMPEMDAKRWERIIEAERKSLERCDIPKFTMYADDAGLYFDGDLVLDELTAQTGVERLLDRIEKISEEDKSWQTGLIRACFESADAADKPHPEGEI